MNQTELIKLFVNDNAVSGSVGEARIIGNQFYHFDTPIIERKGSSYILNTSKYSDQTRMLLKKIRDVLQGKDFIEVNKVSLGYKGSLGDFIEEK